MNDLETTSELTSDEKTMALLSHLSAFIFAIIGPALILVIKGKESKFVEFHAKQALLYQAVTLAINFVIILVVSFLTCGMCFPIFFLPFVTAIYGIVIGMKANEGKWVGYKGMETFGLPEGQELDG